MRYRHQLLLLPALVAFLVSAQPLPTHPRAFEAVLPDRLGDYTVASRTDLSPKPPQRELFREYGLRAAGRAVYLNPAGRRMVAEVYQFDNSEGGHAAYLALVPAGAVRSSLATFMYWEADSVETHAVLAGGVTVVERHNYVFRFQGCAPAARDMAGVAAHLPQFDLTEPKPDGYSSSDSMIKSSERILAGPVSLAKFAPRVPAAVAAFGPGVQGRVARFETPDGTVSRVVFEYPSAAEAEERFNALRALSGAQARFAARSVGVVFDSSDPGEAAELLNDYVLGVSQPEVAWDSQHLWCGAPMTLEGAIGSMFIAYALGCLIGVLRFAERWRDGIPDHTIALGLGPRPLNPNAA